MAVSLFFFSVLEQHRCCKDKCDVDTHNSECPGEDQIQEVVGVSRKWAHATHASCSYQCIRASAVNDERWRSAVGVAAAVELLHISILSRKSLIYKPSVEAYSGKLLAADSIQARDSFSSAGCRTRYQAQ